jgi:hypothetical protein
VALAVLISCNGGSSSSSRANIRISGGVLDTVTSQHQQQHVTSSEKAPLHLRCTHSCALQLSSSAGGNHHRLRYTIQRPNVRPAACQLYQNSAHQEIQKLQQRIALWAALLGAHDFNSNMYMATPHLQRPVLVVCGDPLHQAQHLQAAHPVNFVKTMHSNTPKTHSGGSRAALLGADKPP